MLRRYLVAVAVPQLLIKNKEKIICIEVVVRMERVDVI